MKPYGSNDKVLKTTVSMADSINKIVTGCLVLMAESVAKEANGPHDRGYEHYFKHLEKAYKMLPKPCVSMLRDKFPGWLDAAVKEGEETDKVEDEVPIFAWLCLPDGGSYYNPHKSLTDFVIDEEQEARFSLRTEKPKRPHRNRTNMTRLNKEPRWFIDDANGNQKFQGEYENSDASQSFILQLDKKNRIARLLPIEECYKFEVSRNVTSDTVAKAMIEMNKTKKRRQEEHEMLWGSKDKNKTTNKTRSRSDQKGSSMPLSVPNNRFTEALFGRRVKSKPKNEGFSVAKKSFRRDNVVKRKRGNFYDSSEDEEEETLKDEAETEEFTGLLKNAGAEQWKLMEDLDYQYDRSDDDGDFGGEDNADNAEEVFEDENLFSDDSSDTDEENFVHRKLAADVEKDSEYEDSASDSSDDSELDVSEFLSEHSTYERIAETLAMKSESTLGNQSEPPSSTDAGKIDPSLSKQAPPAKLEEKTLGGKRKREAETMVPQKTEASASQTNGDGPKPAKRRKKVKKKKKKLNIAVVDLNEDNFIRILRENNGRMDFGSFLGHFRNVSHEENKALVRSLRDRLCNPLEATGKKNKFFISLK